jgi:protein involved in polysaccharide export with SLBB domain
MKINDSFLAWFLLLVFISINLFAQDDIQIGQGPKAKAFSNAALYDYSNPETINIKVMIWGYVKFPGQYIVPSRSGVNDLISLAGGPTSDADVDELKLFRINQDSSQSIIMFNYSDLLWTNSSLSNPVKIPKLRAGDILLVPGSPKWYLKDYVSLVLSVVSTFASIATLLVYVYKK